MKSLFFVLFLNLACCFANSPSSTIIITCASGELGSATARVLASDHDLILTGRNKLKLEQLQQELQ